MEKNKAGLVLGIISAIFGIIGGIMWAACAGAFDSLLEVINVATDVDLDELRTQVQILLVLAIIFGIGGSVVTLVGGIQGLHFKKGSFICAAVGCACQLGFIIAIFAILGKFLGGFAIAFCIETIVALILAGVQTLITGLKVLSLRKNGGAPATAAPAPAPVNEAPAAAPVEPAPAPVEEAPAPATEAPVAEEIAATEEAPAATEEEKPTTTEEE